MVFGVQSKTSAASKYNNNAWGLSPRFTPTSEHSSRVKIGFVFLSHISHIHHAAPIAFELSRNETFDVELLISKDRNLNILQSISTKYPNHGCKIVHLQPSYGYKLATKLGRKPCPETRNILKTNARYIERYDALVTATDNLQYLAEKPNRRTKIITTFHGMETAARFGRYTKYSGYDFYLFAGEYRRQREMKNGMVTKNNSKVVGYPKFDLTLNEKRERFFLNERPVVVYAPHWSPKLSSWFDWGLRVLDVFARSKQYNLIFAPHIKRIENRYIPKRLLNTPNILIDIGSEKLTNMKYMNSADIYLGDSSSQVWEFVVNPRPCVFLNPCRKNWEAMDGMEMWQLGEVVDDFSEIESAIHRAPMLFKSYKKRQSELLKERVAISRTPAGKVGASAISEFLQSSRN